MEEKKLSNVKIKTVVDNSISKDDADRIVGSCMFLEPYSNIAILSKKKSGKTTVIYNILKKCATKKTQVMIFAGSVFKDETYKKMYEMLTKKGIDVIRETSFIDPKTGDNYIQEFINEAQREQEAEDEEDPAFPSIPQNGLLKLYSDKYIRECEQKAYNAQRREQRKAKQKKPKKKTKEKLYPEYIIVFDDLNKKLRHNSINEIAKVNRHFKAKIIYSSQRITDIHPDALGQMDYLLMFKSFNNEVLESVRTKIDLSTEEDEFREIYHHATKEKYNFLYVDTARDEFRRNFNYQLQPKE